MKKISLLTFSTTLILGLPFNSAMASQQDEIAEELQALSNNSANFHRGLGKRQFDEGDFKSATEHFEEVLCRYLDQEELPPLVDFANCIIASIKAGENQKAYSIIQALFISDDYPYQWQIRNETCLQEGMCLSQNPAQFLLEISSLCYQFKNYVSAGKYAVASQSHPLDKFFEGHEFNVDACFLIAESAYHHIRQKRNQSHKKLTVTWFERYFEQSSEGNSASL
ncbi:MAG: hypothetical protein GY915_00060 [bacterium]|nr:hypothetical protein [bacterium]